MRQYVTIIARSPDCCHGFSNSRGSLPKPNPNHLNSSLITNSIRREEEEENKQRRIEIGGRNRENESKNMKNPFIRITNNFACER